MEEKQIIHVDMDAFFASVEELLRPDLKNKPVIVGNGVVASASYKAREYGVKAGMPIFKALELCPLANVISGNQSIYNAYAYEEDRFNWIDLLWKSNNETIKQHYNAKNYNISIKSENIGEKYKEEHWFEINKSC